MDKIYIVTHGYEYEGHNFSGSFSDKEKAISYAMKELEKGALEEAKVWSSIIDGVSYLIWFAERDMKGKITESRGDDI